MAMPSPLIHPLAIPENLHWGSVALRFAEYESAKESEGLVPKYNFAILGPEQVDVGHISFKCGDNWHVTFAVGHIGYLVRRDYRGHGYAFQACHALKPFIETLYDSVILTTNPSNRPSMRTIERLGAEFLGIVDVPENDPSYSPGDTVRRRYEWHL